jgi:glycosyltransferase involved in cell wall biosynthesis
MLKRFERVVPGRLPTLQLLPLGIDHRRFGGSSNRDGRGDLVTILTVARLVPFKSVDAGLRAFALLLKTYPRARYVIAGDGWERASLESLARELRITEHVAFLGVQDEEQLTRLYGEADIFLFPSGTSSDGAQEGQGLALLEAQAAGLPVVATDSGGIPENMVPGRSGFLVREQAVEEMAGRLLELAVNPDLRKVLGRAGRTFVAESRSLAHWGRGLEALYKGVMGSTRTWQGGAPTT